MQEIKSIGVLSAAIMAGILYFILGEFGALTLAIMSIIHGHLIRGIILLIFLGFVYGIVGAIFVAIAAWLYNLIARQIGGIKIEIAPRP